MNIERKALSTYTATRTHILPPGSAYCVSRLAANLVASTAPIVISKSCWATGTREESTGG